MEIYKLLPDTNGFILFQKDNHTILVDTGSVHSFSVSDEPLQICGTEIPISFQANELKNRGIDLELISKHVGVSVTTILGLDGLERFKFIVDESAGRIQFDTEEISLSPDWHTIPMERIDGCIIVSIKVNGVPRKMILDSAVTTSFAESLWLGACVRKGNRTDFHVFVGYNTAPILRALSEVGGFTFPIRYSVLSEEVKQKIAKANAISENTIHGILGCALMEHHRGYLDLEKGIFKAMK